MRVECRPLSNYPVPETRNRREAAFHRKVTRQGQWNDGSPRSWTETKRILLTDALDLLAREVEYLGCKTLIIEADFREGQIRQDGWPKGNASPASPRVVVSLVESQHGPLRYPCDTFTRFEDNVLAVARALEALRMVDRYGVTRRGEQYAGWKALPSSTDANLSVEQAARIVAAEAGYLPDDAPQLAKDVNLARSWIRDAIRRSHPDMPSGSNEAFHRVQTARKVLTAHHGVSL